MADWIKLRHTLVRSPKIRMLARHLKCNKLCALGLAVTWLCWVDEQTTDGATSILPDELDDELGFRGGADALCEIGWAALGEDGYVRALEFDKHCGETAKARADGARRTALSKARKKARSEEVTDFCYQGNEKMLPNTLPEKNRIEDNNKGGEYKEDSFNSAPAPQTLAAPAAPPPFEKKSIFRSPDERAAYKAWLAPVKAAHPAGREMQEMGAKLHGTALAAFRAVPQAGEHGELLAAFYASAIDTSTNGKPFKRPNEFIWYLTDLADVLVAAKRWQKETRWKPKSATPAQPTPPPAPPAEEMTEEEKQSFFSAMRPNRHNQQNTPECA